MLSGFLRGFRAEPQAPERLTRAPSSRCLVPGSVCDSGGGVGEGTSVTFFCRGDGVGLFSALSASLSLLLPSVLVAVAVAMAAVVAAVAALVMLAPLACRSFFFSSRAWF